MKALITDNVHPYLIEAFTNAGIQSRYLPSINYEEVLEIISDFDILIINSKIPINEELLSRATKLQKVGRLGSGLEIIDFEACKKYGVEIFSSPEGNRDAVAEHAIGMLLALFNKLRLAQNEVLDFSWQREAMRGEELMGKTIGIVGFGNTGKALAKKLSGFDVDVLFYDKYIDEPNNLYAKQVSLQELQEKADVISFHVPLTNETNNYFNEDFLAKVVKPIYLINTSRGKVVKESILLQAIKENKILGVCLDVFENEKAKTYTEAYKQQILDLHATHKVLFSPHVAGWTVQSKLKLAKILVNKILL